MTIRPNTSLLARFRTLLAGTFLLLAILTPPTAFAEEETPTPIAEVEGIAQFEAMLAKAEEFVAAGDDAEWSDFVTEDADTAWGLISGLAGSEDSAIVDGETVGVGEYVTGKLNGASAEVNKAIYDNVWSNADALTPWLTHNIWVLIAAFLVFIMQKFVLLGHCECSFVMFGGFFFQVMFFSFSHEFLLPNSKPFVLRTSVIHRRRHFFGKILGHRMTHFRGANFSIHFSLFRV